MTSPGFIVLSVGLLIALSGIVLFALSNKPSEEKWSVSFALAGLVVMFISLNMLGVESRHPDPTITPTEITSDG